MDSIKLSPVFQTCQAIPPDITADLLSCFIRLRIQVPGFIQKCAFPSVYSQAGTHPFPVIPVFLDLLPAGKDTDLTVLSIVKILPLYLRAGLPEQIALEVIGIVPGFSPCCPSDQLIFPVVLVSLCPFPFLFSKRFPHRS